MKLRRIDATKAKDPITEGSQLLALASRSGATTLAFKAAACLEVAGGGLLASESERNGGDVILAAMGLRSDPAMNWLL